MKPKRIKALKQHITAQDNVFNESYDITEPCYVLRQSDVRALAEQFISGIDECFRKLPYNTPLPEAKLTAMLYALKLHGITPGRARGGAQ